MGAPTILLPEIGLQVASGVDPLTPDDIAETVVFIAGRRENVVVAVSPIGKVGVPIADLRPRIP